MACVQNQPIHTQTHIYIRRPLARTGTARRSSRRAARRRASSSGRWTSGRRVAVILYIVNCYVRPPSLFPYQSNHPRPIQSNSINPSTPSPHNQSGGHQRAHPGAPALLLLHRLARLHPRGHSLLRKAGMSQCSLCCACMIYVTRGVARGLTQTHNRPSQNQPQAPIHQHPPQQHPKPTPPKQGVQFYTQTKTVTSNWQFRAESARGAATMPTLK